jgi:hypothetical protein
MLKWPTPPLTLLPSYRALSSTQLMELPMVNCTDPRASGWAHDASTGWLTWQGMCATTVPPAGEWERSQTMCKHFLHSSQDIQRAARTQAPQVLHIAHTYSATVWEHAAQHPLTVSAVPPVHHFTLSGLHVCSQTPFAFTTPSR